MAGAVLGKILILVLLILFIQRRPRGHVRAQGTCGGSMITARLLQSLDGRGRIFLGVLALMAAVIPLLNLLLPPSSPFHVPTYVVSLLGKYSCYAILALALDLVWGYCGILSLGHGAFFALGGYAMGMYLMRQIGTRGVYAPSGAAGLHGVPQLEGTALVLVRLRLVSLRRPYDCAGAGPARVPVRLAHVPQPRNRRLPFHHYAGDDLRAAARVLPQ